MASARNRHCANCIGTLSVPFAHRTENREADERWILYAVS